MREFELTIRVKVDRECENYETITEQAMTEANEWVNNCDDLIVSELSKTETYENGQGYSLVMKFKESGKEN